MYLNAVTIMDSPMADLQPIIVDTPCMLHLQKMLLLWNKYKKHFLSQSLYVALPNSNQK